MNDWVHLLRCKLPECHSTNYKVQKFNISERDAVFHALRCALNGRPQRAVVAGSYTKLTSNGTLWMSDTPAELNDHAPAMENAKGTCLVTGLGLGCITQGMLEKTGVTRVIVIEKSIELIELVGPYYMNKYGDRLKLRNEDALTYVPPKDEHYNCVWHDIWPDICTSNLAEMERLRCMYENQSDWIGVWSEKAIRTHTSKSLAH